MTLLSALVPSAGFDAALSETMLSTDYEDYGTISLSSAGEALRRISQGLDCPSQSNDPPSLSFQTPDFRDSNMSPYSSEKKEEEGFNSTIVPVANFLPAVREEDADEGRKLAGDTKNEFTQQARRLSSRLREYGSHSVQEFDAVKRKVDKRLLPILAAVYFSQFLVRSSASRQFS